MTSGEAGGRPAAARGGQARLAVLDVLRAIAVLLVLGRHLLVVERGVPPALAAVLRGWQAFGWMGVDLFFVLSGFLVSALLFDEHRLHGELRPWRFLARRGFKIYPGFYALLLVTWLWFHPPSDKLLFEALFVQNYLGWFWRHTWSLAVEEHFYFGLALLLWAFARLRQGPQAFAGLPKLCALVLPLVLALRVWTFASDPHGYLLLPTHLRLDALLFGALLAYYWTYERPWLAATVRRLSWPLAVASVLLLLPSLLLPLKDSFVVNTIGFTTNYLGFGGLVILAVVTSQQDGGRPWHPLTPMAWLGFYSYSIYLWHLPVKYLTATTLPPLIGWPATIAVYLAASVLAGVLMAKLIEIPFLHLRDRLLPSRATVQRTAVPRLSTAAVGAAAPDRSLSPSR